MPRFFFHLHNDIDAPDDEGAEFTDLAAALSYAQRQVRFLVGETVKETGRIVLSHHIDIADAQRDVLCTVHFGDVVKVEP